MVNIETYTTNHQTSVILQGFRFWPCFAQWDRCVTRNSGVRRMFAAGALYKAALHSDISVPGWPNGPRWGPRKNHSLEIKNNAKTTHQDKDIYWNWVTQSYWVTGEPPCFLDQLTPKSSKVLVNFIEKPRIWTSHQGDPKTIYPLTDVGNQLAYRATFTCVCNHLRYITV